MRHARTNFLYRFRIPKLLRLRAEKAKILGFDTYADLSLAFRTPEKTDTIFKFYDDLIPIAKQKAIEELEVLQTFANSKGFKGKINHWDKLYYTEMYKAEKLQVSDEKARELFTLDGVLTGLFQKTEQLFDVKIKPHDKEVPVWDESVTFYDVFDNPVLSSL